MDVLFLAESVGHGHIRAAQAVISAISQLAPNVETALIESTYYFDPAFKDVWEYRYNQVFSKLPGLEEIFLNIPRFRYAQDIPHTLRNFLNTKSDKAHLPRNIVSIYEYRLNFYKGKLQKLLLSEFLSINKPKVVACTFWYPCKMVSDLKLEGEINSKLCVITTNFVCPIDFLQPTVDLYFVASPMVRDQLLKYDIHKSKIRVTGVPISLDFIEPLDKNKLYEEFNLKSDVPTILVICNGIESEAARRILEAIISLQDECDIQSLVVAGSDEMFCHLKSLIGCDRKSIQIFGYTNVMHKLMDVSDIVISKTGGSTCAEILAKGIPMIIQKPSDDKMYEGYAQYVEIFNANFLLENQVALEVFGHKDSVFLSDIEVKIKKLLDDKNLRRKMKENMKLIAKPNAALDVARDILELI